MKKEYWLGVQRELLETKGIFKLYVVLLVIFHVVTMFPDIPALAYTPRLLVIFLGLLSLAIVWVTGRSGRTKEQSRTLLLYGLVLLLLIPMTISRFF